MGINPNQYNGQHYVDFKGYAPGIKNELLQYNGDQKKAKAGTQNPGNKKRHGPNLMTVMAKTVLQVFVNGG